MDVIPVSDPAIFSEAQRFAQIQAIMQRAAVMPQMYDQRNVEKMFLRNLKISADEVLQAQPGSEDIDPVSENVAATMGRPVFVIPKQDHMAHLKTHLAFLKSPLFGSNPVIARTFMYPIATHLRDHLLNYYLVEAHNAVDMAQREDLIQEDADEQVAVILQVQQFIEQQLGAFGQELAQIDQVAQQFKPQPPMPPDKSMEIAQMNAQLQGQAMQQRAQIDQAKLQLEQQKLQIEAQTDAQKNQEDMQKEQMRQMSENERLLVELQARERMNTADNDTAMRLAATELATGEKFAVSTGTGINPGAR
jgi:hypothetical protein